MKAHPVDKLLAVLQPQQKTAGSVVSVQGRTVFVSTNKGVVEAQNSTETTYSPGDQVLMKNGVLLGKRLPDKDVPVYLV